jgi:beta-glucosidase
VCLISIFCSKNKVAVKDGSIDPNENPIDILKLRYALIEKKIGSFLTPAPLGVTAGEKWQQIVRTIQQVAINETNSKIPILLGIDSIHGATFIRDTVLYPQPISMAASFNEEIARIYGEIVAKEQRAAGFPWNFR